MNARLLFSVLLSFGVAGSAIADDFAAPDPQTANGVNRLVRRLERAFNSKDRPLVLSCFADDAILVDPPEKGVGGSQVFSQESLRSLLELSLTHRTLEAAEMVMIDGTGAFTLRHDDRAADLLLTSAIRVSSINDVPTTIGFVDRRFIGAIYEDQRWQICFSFPCFVESRVVVAKVLPGSQAERLGMRIGDVITHHLQMPIFDSEQLSWRAEMFYDEPPDRPLRVLVRRDQQLLPILFRPGEMGVETQLCFEGRSDTLTLRGPQVQEHPVVKVIAAYHRALQGRDAAGVMATFCPRGFVFGHGLPSAPTGCVVTLRNASDTIPQELKALESKVRLETIDISDIRLIAYGDLALAGWHVSATSPDGSSVNHQVIACFVENEGRWSIVGMPWRHDQVLGL